MRVLVACEYSGRVRDAFIALGHDAMSCDLLPTESPGPHYQGDVFDVIGDGWDLMIAHPPCTYLTIAAEWAYQEVQKKKIKPGTLIGSARQAAREEAIQFVLGLANAPIDKIAIENPVGVLSSRWREPDQFIQPYEYGDDASKKTCLWLKNLPRLTPTAFAPPPPRTFRRLPKLLAAVGQSDRQRAEQRAAVGRQVENPQHDLGRMGRGDGRSVGGRMSSELLERLAELNPDALLADGLEDAFIGYTVNHHHAHVAVYDYDKCVEVLVARDGMTHEDAEEYLSFNTLGAYVGENGPIYIVMGE